MRNKIRGIAAGIALAAVTLTVPAAAAQAKPAENSACLATFYANKAFGNTGEDVRGFATSNPGEVGEFSSEFAKYHDGTVGGCASHFPG